VQQGENLDRHHATCCGAQQGVLAVIWLSLHLLTVLLYDPLQQGEDHALSYAVVDA
jgi:hypothetical protein